MATAKTTAKTSAGTTKAAPAKTTKASPAAKVVMPAPAKKKDAATVYHVSKRGETKEDREWKVFIQGSTKVIKLFDTQAEALDYARDLAANKDDGSYVVLHGLDGKIRKY